jgi:riboflavin synthase
MFTGLVEAKGKLTARRSSGAGGGAILEVECTIGPLAVGESVSVDGCCLTVKRLLAQGFEADASVETLERTTLGHMPLGGEVNLERAVAMGERLGGHLVTGHVDATCTLALRQPLGDAVTMRFELPPRLARFVAEKGSAAVNGVSLTVNAVSPSGFDVAIIPHTLAVTTLGGLSVGGRANLEVDLLARYVERLLDVPTAPNKPDDSAWLERLKRAGYI